MSSHTLSSLSSDTCRVTKPNEGIAPHTIARTFPFGFRDSFAYIHLFFMLEWMILQSLCLAYGKFQDSESNEMDEVCT